MDRLFSSHRIAILGALLLSLSMACQKEKGQHPDFIRDKVFYAELPNEGDTKTFLDAEAQLYWSAEDRISVFRSTTNEKYRFDGVDGEISSAFSKDDSSVPGVAFSTNYAIFPYNALSTCASEGSFKVSIPAEQTFVDNSFGPQDNMMVAVTENAYANVFRFKNVCGYLVLKIYGGDTVRRIRLQGNAGEKIAGDALLTVAANGQFSVDMEESAGTEITLDCGESGVQLSASEPTLFWMVVPPVTFASGFTVQIENLGGKSSQKQTHKNVTVLSNKAQPMSAFEFSLSSMNSITSFSLTDGVESYPAFDIGQDIYIQIPTGTDVTSLRAVFVHNGSTVKIGDTTQESGVTVNDYSDFASPIVYSVFAENGDENQYKVYLFDLPVVIIDTPGNVPITSKTVWTEGAHITILNEGNVDLDASTSIRGRGNASWAFPKKPFALKLDSKAQILGMPANKRWCLLANWRDRTLIRNDLTFYIAKKASGLEWTPSGQFVEVILNGDVIGNYYLCEQIKIDENRVNITEMGSADLTGDAVSGAYLLEYDNGFDEANKFMSATFNYPINIKSPDEDGDPIKIYDDIDPSKVIESYTNPIEQHTYIKNYINSLEEMLNDNERLLKHEYEDYLDVNSFIDWWMVLEISEIHEPGNPRSCYMYKGRDGVDSPAGTRAKLKAGPVWDFDMWSYVPKRVNPFYTYYTLYYKKLFNDPSFVAKAKARWNEFKLELTDLDDYIDNIAATLANSNSRNIAMWPIEGWSTKNDDEEMTYEEAIATMKSTLAARIARLDVLINALPVTYDNKDTGTEDFGGQDDQSGDFGFGF